MYVEILNDDLVGLANTTSRYMLDHLFLFYGRITAADIEQNFENMRNAWDPQQTVETLFKQIQDCVDFTEARGVSIGAAKKCPLPTQKASSQGNSTLLAADGTKNQKLTRLEIISRFMLLLLTTSTDK
jgi:hypothetical protein